MLMSVFANARIVRHGKSNVSVQSKDNPIVLYRTSHKISGVIYNPVGMDHDHEMGMP
jgi:hypothetical protein